jgi:hypothetical protein
MHSKGEGFGFFCGHAVPRLFFSGKQFFLQNSNEVCEIKKIIYIFSSKNIYMVETKNSFVRVLPGILSAISKTRNLVFTYYRHFKGTD